MSTLRPDAPVFVPPPPTITPSSSAAARLTKIVVPPSSSSVDQRLVVTSHGPADGGGSNSQEHKLYNRKCGKAGGGQRKQQHYPHHRIPPPTSIDASIRSNTRRPQRSTAGATTQQEEQINDHNDKKSNKQKSFTQEHTSTTSHIVGVSANSPPPPSHHQLFFLDDKDHSKLSPVKVSLNSSFRRTKIRNVTNQQQSVAGKGYPRRSCRQQQQQQRQQPATNHPDKQASQVVLSSLETKGQGVTGQHRGYLRSKECNSTLSEQPITVSKQVTTSLSTPIRQRRHDDDHDQHHRSATIITSSTLTTCNSSGSSSDSSCSDNNKIYHETTKKEEQILPMEEFPCLGTSQPFCGLNWNKEESRGLDTTTTTTAAAAAGAIDGWCNHAIKTKLQSQVQVIECPPNQFKYLPQQQQNVQQVEVALGDSLQTQSHDAYAFRNNTPRLTLLQRTTKSSALAKGIKLNNIHLVQNEERANFHCKDTKEEDKGYNRHCAVSTEDVEDTTMSDGQEFMSSYLKSKIMKRNIDISRLRDRWWDALRDRSQKMQQMRLQEQEQQQQQQQQDYEPSVPLPLLAPLPDDFSVEVPMHHCTERSANLDSEESQSMKSHPISMDQQWSLIDDKYRISLEPLHDAIRQNDETALQNLLQLNSPPVNLLASLNVSRVSPLQLAVQLNKPKMIHILLWATRRKGSQQWATLAVTTMMMTTTMTTAAGEGAAAATTTIATSPPLHLAAKVGYEECLQILMADGGTISLFHRDGYGNNVLHACCSGCAPVSTLQMILNMAGSTSSRKLLQSRNQIGQTPFHIACEAGRVDVVDTILTSNKTGLTLLTKVMSIQDDAGLTPLLVAVSSGSTDVAMSLLMWRGNSVLSTKGSVICSLTWAVQCRNLEMVLLLLEFNDPSGRGYNLSDALWHAVDGVSHEGDDQSIILEIIGVLIKAGGNPCQPTDKVRSAASTTRTTFSALGMAAQNHSVTSIQTMLDTYRVCLDHRWSKRRCNPVLARQPESFFAGMEANEDAEYRVALCDALVTSLFHGWHQREMAPLYHECTLALYRRGAQLNQAGMKRLRASMRAKMLKPLFIDTSIPVYHLVSHQVRRIEPIGPFVTASRPLRPAYFWSYQMLQLPWANMNDESLPWAYTLLEKTPHPIEIIEPDVELVTIDGMYYATHSEILAIKSAKLASAIRFAQLSSNQSNMSSTTNMKSQSILSKSGTTVIHLSISSTMCYYLLCHIYHGCLVPPNTIIDNTNDWLELLVIADEYICLTLMQECELRLMAHYIPGYNHPKRYNDDNNNKVKEYDVDRNHGQYQGQWIQSMNYHHHHDARDGIVTTIPNESNRLLILPETVLEILTVAQRVGDSFRDSGDYLLQVYDENNDHPVCFRGSSSSTDATTTTMPSSLYSSCTIDDGSSTSHIKLLPSSLSCISVSTSTTTQKQEDGVVVCQRFKPMDALREYMVQTILYHFMHVMPKKKTNSSSSFFPPLEMESVTTRIQDNNNPPIPTTTTETLCNYNENNYNKRSNNDFEIRLIQVCLDELSTIGT